jgi:DNA-binding transcriptional LysR family regulator
MDVSLHQLRGFVVVAEEQHFGRAAARLNLTQPPLSRQVQALEAALGVALFDRVGRGVRLNAAGEVFLAHCRRALALIDAAPDATRRAAEGETGALRLAFTAIGAYAVLGDFLALVHERLPAVGVALTELASPGQFELLAGMELDLGLVRPPIPEQFASVLVHSEDLVLAVPEGHPLATADGPVALADVTDEYIGYSPEGSRYLHDICAAMIGMNRYRVSQLVSQVPTMLALVRAGTGCALVPRSITAMGVHGVRYLHDICAAMIGMNRYRVSQLVSQVPTMLALVRAGTGCALVPRSITAMGVHGVRYLEVAPADAHSVTLHACWSPDNPNPALHRLVESVTG